MQSWHTTLYIQDNTVLIILINVYAWGICALGTLTYVHRCKTKALVEHSPCFLVAKFLRNNLRQFQTQTVSYFLR